MAISAISEAYPAVLARLSTIAAKASSSSPFLDATWCERPSINFWWRSKSSTDSFRVVPDPLKQFGNQTVVVQLLLPFRVGSGPAGSMGEVVLLRHHPIQPIDVLIPLGHIPSEGVVMSPEG